MKRLISIILVITLCFGLCPQPVQAVANENPAMDSGNISLEGQNALGNLLSEEIIQQQAAEEESYNGGYGILDLTISGNTATVEYTSLEAATLIVAIYTEDGLTMLNSGNTTVSAEEERATVTISGTMPQYFRAAAYLVDVYDMSPLCSAYSTPMYTKDMQELLASTVDDYEADRVLNLDEDKTTNFAVYDENTKLIEKRDGVNTVVSANEENRTYVIENADEQILLSQMLVRMISRM